MVIQFPLLAATDIEVKVKQIGAKGAVALLYKTARTDMDILDRTVGPENWECNYEEIKGNLYCTLSIFTGERWVRKQDCGTESRQDDEGNEKKGEASDAFKRAGFKWGIGRELYSSPFIFLNVPTTAKGKGFELADRYQRFDVQAIGYDENRRISSLIIGDEKTKRVVYQFPSCGAEAPQTAPNLLAPSVPPAPAAAFNQPGTHGGVTSVSPRIARWNALARQYGVSSAALNVLRAALARQGIFPDISSETMTDAQFNAMIQAIDAALAADQQRKG